MPRPRNKALRIFNSVIIAGTLATVSMLAGCSGGGLPSLPKVSSLNPFAPAPAPPLPGKRIPVLPEKDQMGGAQLAAATGPITLPPAISNVSWSQPGGTANNAPGHLALGAQVRRAWSTDVGNGSNSRARLTSSPVVADGRVYTLDASARVTAVSASGGSIAWRTSLAPQGERGREGYGGGLAFDDNRLIASTGFGTIVSLDPRSGKKLWEKDLKASVRASPTAAQGRIFVISTDGRFFCLSGQDGSILWQFRGLPESQSISSNPSPAVDGNVVAVPYPNGDLVVLNVADGTALWTESLARSRSASSFSSMSDAARPAISGGVVFAVGHAGRMIAAQQATGERLWSLEVPGTQTPWVAGDNVFVVDTSGKLSAIGRRDGAVKWAIKLPDARTWSGPTLAGSTLWLASHKGHLAGVDAATGRVTQKLTVGDPVYIAPVVANGQLFVLTDRARLVSFR